MRREEAAFERFVSGRELLFGLLAHALHAEGSFRGGLRAIPPTQMRAARSLGMSAPLAFRLVVLPQLFRTMFHPMTNQMVWAMLMTSLGVVVGLNNDLTGVTQAYAVFVAQVEAGGPAAKAGVKEGDLLLSAGDQPLTGLDDLLRALDHHSIDRPMAFGLIREGRLMTVSITPKIRKRG